MFESQDIKSSYFLNPTGIRGLLHTKRVLFNVLVLCYCEGIKGKSQDLLLAAAKYHDIGRINDDKDETHGILSFKKAMSMNLIKSCCLYDDTLKFIIENHCIPDNKAYENIKNYNINNIDETKKLYNILCDADSIDRIRFRDIKIEYLRTNTAKRMIALAQQIYNNINLLDIQNS